MRSLTSKRFVSYFALPILATIVFIILIFSPFSDWLRQEEPSYGGRIFILILIFFVSMYIINRLTNKFIVKSLKYNC